MRIAPLFLAAAVAALVQAQDATAPVYLAKPNETLDQWQQDQSPAWQRFVSETSGTWVSQWNHATRTPKAIYGTGLPLAD